MAGIRDRIKDLRRVRAGDLVPHAKNWRTHPPEQRAALAAIVSELGFAGAVLTRELPDGRLGICDGHMRQELDADAVLPVLVTDLTEEEADKLLLTYDPIGAMAKADAEKLDALMKGVQTDSGALRDMIHNLAMAAKCPSTLAQDGLTDPDDVPAVPDAATTKPGDLIILGNHRLLCGDSSKPEDLDRLLGGQVIHLVNTDPPYNVKVEPRSNNAIAAGLSSFEMPTTHHQGLDLARHPEKAKATHKKLRAKDRPLANDFVTDEAFDALLAAWFGNIARVLLPGRSFYIWGGYANCANYPPVLKRMELYFSQAIIWIKGHPVLTRKDFMGNHDWCFYGWREGAGHEFFGPSNVPDTWEVKKVNPQAMIHLTEKPVELASRAIQYSSRHGENVLDLFGGSGSTLMACEQNGRNGFLMELDPLYCDVICQRYLDFVGDPSKVRIVTDSGEVPYEDMRAMRKAKAAG